MSKQLIEAPASTDSYRYETLGYIEAYDAILNGDSVFVANKKRPTPSATGASASPATNPPVPSSGPRRQRPRQALVPMGLQL